MTNKSSDPTRIHLRNKWKQEKNSLETVGKMIQSFENQ